jgi:hypothetical protein
LIRIRNETIFLAPTQQQPKTGALAIYVLAQTARNVSDALRFWLDFDMSPVRCLAVIARET